MSRNYTNSNYASLAAIGTRTNPRNAVVIRTAETDTVGVSLSQPASKKAVQMEMVLPISRSTRGSRRAAHLTLSGRQAREIYETLSRFYSGHENE
jgi:hypothetical protein